MITVSWHQGVMIIGYAILFIFQNFHVLDFYEYKLILLTLLNNLFD